MSDWGTVVAGLGGAAIGVVGTLLGGIVTSNAESKRLKLAEKRNIYAACIATFEPLLMVMNRNARVTSQESKQVVLDHVTAMRRALIHVRLVAPRAVVSPAVALPTHLASYKEDTPAWVKEFNSRQQTVIEAMRADLGETD